MTTLRTLQDRFDAGFPGFKNEVVMKKYLSIALLTGALMFSGCGNSDEFVLTNTNVIVAPVCVDDAYTTNQDTTLTVNAANGVLSNDTSNGGVVVAFDATSTANGTVNVNQTGAFTYTPANSFTGTDTFTYTVANSAGQRTCTVTITVVAVNGFFVDAVNGNDGTGSFNGGLPFQTIQAAVAAAPTNADIVVLPGSYTGAVNLKDGQRLLGSGSTLVNPQAVNRPQLTGPVVMADGNTLDFLAVTNTPATVGAGDGLGDAIIGDDSSSGVVTNCVITSPADEGVSGINISGDWTITGNTISNSGGYGGDFETQNGSTLAITISQNNISNAQGALGLTSLSTSNFIAFVVSNTFASSQGVGDTVEIFVQDTSDFCLDLENNVNDGSYRLSNNSASTLRIEEYPDLTVAQPGGAGNTGTVNVDMGVGFSDPTPVVDGFCLDQI